MRQEDIYRCCAVESGLSIVDVRVAQRIHYIAMYFDVLYDNGTGKSHELI